MYFYIDDLISRIEYFRVRSKNNINKVTECGILLLNQKKNSKLRCFDKLLIIYQNESKKWGLPKGHLDDKEFAHKKFLDCAKRELYEETGIYLNHHRHVKIGTYIIKNKLFYIYQILCDTLLTNPIDSTEIGNSTWINLKDLINMNKNECNITINDTINKLLLLQF